MAPQARVRFYREFLTPALHRRFTRAAGLALLLCYVEAIAIGDKSSILWSWFPLGPAGIRTLLLFITSLSIFVLRVAQLHFGSRITDSPFETFRQYAFRFNTLQTLGFYYFSAWWFGEVYMFSVPQSADLSWVAEGRPHERRRLNERPLYLRSVFFMLAATQALMHLYHDYDRVVLPMSQFKFGRPTDKPTDVEPPTARLKRDAPMVLRSAVARAVATSIVGPFIYALLVRPFAWPWSLYLARLFWSIPKDSAPPRFPPYHISLILRSAMSGMLLLYLWDMSNVAFSAFVAQEPLKKGRSLTDDSRDPNGSLLNGLKSKKEVPKTFAFWELLYIGNQFEARRKSIFSEIDRAGGTTWSQAATFCLDTISGINDRIDKFYNPPSTTIVPVVSTQQPQEPLQTLPRLSSALRQDPVLTNAPPPTNRRKKIEANVGSTAKYYGQSPSSRTSLSPRVKKVGRMARDKLLTKEQQNAIKPATIASSVYEYFVQYLRTPVGAPFRRTFKRRLASVVLGSPESQLQPIICAIDSISCLAIASLKEDQFGTANKDIPMIIRTFVSSITNIERITQNMPVHWTDTEFEEADGKGREVKEVELVKDHLKFGLSQLVLAFGNYAVDMGLSRSELGTARETADLDAP
ncbi:hypothetical protein MMC30_001542 [Trapelia coarctata]|nr:hypothetical protein [Trapelia coarctata]